MIRARKDVSWDTLLEPYDLAYLSQYIDCDGWYPMGSFERMGNAILGALAGGDVDAARMWGATSVDQLLEATSVGLVVEGDPVDTLMRFRVVRSTFFDFDALQVRENPARRGTDPDRLRDGRGRGGGGVSSDARLLRASSGARGRDGCARLVRRALVDR